MFEREISKTLSNFYKRFPELTIGLFFSTERVLVTIIAKKKLTIDAGDVSGQIQTNTSTAIFATAPLVLSTIVEIK